MRKLILSLLLVLLTTCPALAAEKAGVTLPDTITIDGKTLILNGIALREKFFVDVYVAGLYIEKKCYKPEMIFAKNGYRQMVMHFVRDVEAKKISKAWTDGFKANMSKTDFDAIKPDLDALNALMADIKEGQAFKFTYDPEKGNIIEIAGKVVGTIGGKELANAMLSTWIGPKPGPGKSFKKAILNQ